MRHHYSKKFLAHPIGIALGVGLLVTSLFLSGCDPRMLQDSGEGNMNAIDQCTPGGAYAVGHNDAAAGKPMKPDFFICKGLSASTNATPENVLNKRYVQGYMDEQASANNNGINININPTFINGRASQRQ